MPKKRRIIIVAGGTIMLVTLPNGFPRKAEANKMRGRVNPLSQEAKETLRALRRSARTALELGIKTGTPVYVIKNGKIVDLTKEHPTAKKSSSRRAAKK